MIKCAPIKCESPILRAACVSVVLAALSCAASAQEPIGKLPVPTNLPDDAPSLFAQTFGGKQLWDDHMVFYDWRIQRNTLTGYFRLLDGADRRRAWGSFEHCEKTLDGLRERQKLEPMHGRVVLLLHGLGRSRTSMTGLSDFLTLQGEMQVISVGYASTRADVNGHAATLGKIISRLEGVEQIDFVAHSLGNIVVRRYLALQADEKTRQPCGAKFGRFVMLCPPNHGAAAADGLAPSEAARFVAGPAIAQLGRGWKEFGKTLVTPAFPFGILAGGRGDDEGFNPLIEGDDDMVIRVATTKLAGADDFCVVPSPHTFFMDDKVVRLSTLSFLQHGYFVSAERRRPLTEADEPAPSAPPPLD
jgi:pimeloyl-ACP methyl ester carboxylesterase